jgi:hypothetical protein
MLTATIYVLLSQIQTETLALRFLHPADPLFWTSGARFENIRCDSQFKLFVRGIRL